MDNHLNLQFASSLKNITEINSSFAAGELRVCYTGANRNGSFISKDSIEAAIPSMFNCPVVCNYDVESDTIGGHDVDCVRTDDGGIRIVNATSAVGVIPQSAKYYFETVTEEDGTEHEYFVTEAILWKRAPAYSKLVSDGIEAQSMEITVREGYSSNGLFVIDDFIFTAFCLLGEGVEPCFESASLQMFDLSDCKKQFAEMMNEFKEAFKMVNTSEEDDIHPKNYSEGGKEQLEQKMELLARFGLTLEELEFDIEPMSIEELEMELKKLKGDDDDDDQGGEPNSVDPEEPADPEDPEEPENGDEGDEGDAQFALTGEQFRDGLIEALGAEKIETCWGEMSRYMYCDYNSDACEVYCYDMEDWKLYGFTYSMNGDNVVIDFANKKRKKFSIVDFDEGDAEFSFRHIFEAVADASASHKASELNSEFETVKAGLEEKYNAASDTINEINTELEKLRSYQTQKLAEERAADEEAVFDMFTDLVGVEAFEELRANCSELSIEELEDKCYALRGRNNSTHTFSSQKQKSPRLPVGRSQAEDEPYGGLFIEFPPNR